MKATRAIPVAVQDVLTACEVEGVVVRLPAQLDRKLYLAVNEVLEGLGGKWDRKAKGHVFRDDPRGAIEDAALRGSFTDLDQLHQFFETPAPVVERLLALTRPTAAERVLEPSAGRGAIVRRVPTGAALDVFELDGRHEPELRAALTAGGRDSWAMTMREDFLTRAPVRIFDVVVMTPPFADGRDVEHVEHALRFLKPRGRLAAVMAAGVTFRMDERTRGFREFFALRGGTIELLPAGSFRESGTGVRTVVAHLGCA